MKPAHRPLPAGDADVSGWKADRTQCAVGGRRSVAGADKYVRATVPSALVLFLVAMGERFKVRGVRIAANTVADGLYAVSTLARL
jgi:hypothetical protein